MNADQLTTLLARPDYTDLLTEARGWLRDCGLTDAGPNLTILHRVQRYYEGGLAAFVADTADLA